MAEPYPKSKQLHHNRRIAKRSKRTEFSTNTRLEIAERDNGLCVRCGTVAHHIHHITFRSALGEDVAHKRNGVCICFSCHSFAHSSREGREFFEHWRDTRLDEQGDLIRLPFDELEE